MNAIKTLLLTLLLGGLSLPTFANNLSEIYKQLGLSEDVTYTADMEIQMQMPQGMPPMGPTKVYFKKGNMRTEMEMQGMKMVTLMQKDGTVYSYNDMTKSWMKTDINQAMQGAPVPQYTKIGEETVDGLACTKYEMKDAANGATGIVWVSDQMIYKNVITLPQGSTTVLFKNIQKKDLEDSLFTLPEGANVQDLGAMIQAQGGAMPTAPQQ